MDWQTILNLALGVGLPILAGWVQKQATARKELEDSFTAFRIKVAEEYVRHINLSEIKEQLTRIEGMLHTKADKVGYREGI